MKKLFSILVAMTLLLSTMITPASAFEMDVTLDGEPITFSDITGSQPLSTFTTVMDDEGFFNLVFNGNIFYISADCDFGGASMTGYLGFTDNDIMYCIQMTEELELTAPLTDCLMGRALLDYSANLTYFFWVADGVFLMVDPTTITDEILADAAAAANGETTTVEAEEVEEVVEEVVVEETTDETSFSDVAEDDAFYDAVLWAVDAGVTTGYADGTFRPASTCTRGQVVTFLYRAMGEPAVTTTENPFSDVSEDSAFYDAILWAVENGITTGYTDGTFRPSETCTSAQVITFLYRSLGSPEATDFDSELAASAATAYAPAITWADAISLLDGMDFVPSAASPRSDIVTYLYLVDGTHEMA